MAGLRGRSGRKRGGMDRFRANYRKQGMPVDLAQLLGDICASLLQSAFAFYMNLRGLTCVFPDTEYCIDILYYTLTMLHQSFWIYIHIPASTNTPTHTYTSHARTHAHTHTNRQERMDIYTVIQYIPTPSNITVYKYPLVQCTIQTHLSHLNNSHSLYYGQ